MLGEVEGNILEVKHVCLVLLLQVDFGGALTDRKKSTMLHTHLDQNSAKPLPVVIIGKYVLWSNLHSFRVTYSHPWLSHQATLLFLMTGYWTSSDNFK